MCVTVFAGRGFSHVVRYSRMVAFILCPLGGTIRELVRCARSPRIAIRGLSRVLFPAPHPRALLLMTQDVPIYIKLMLPVAHGFLLAPFAPHLAHPAVVASDEPGMLFCQPRPWPSILPRQLHQYVDMLTAHCR